MHSCDILDNGLYAFYASACSDASTVIDATDNWWGVADSASIEALVFHDVDNVSCPIVDYVPFAEGPYNVPSCCLGRVGDANGLGGDEPTIGDVSAMIDARFISGTCDGIVNCLAEADINQSGGDDPTCDDITIGDISYLIDYLFITGPTLGLPDCL